VLQILTKQGVRQPHVRILHNTAWPKAAGIMLACTRAGLQPTVDGDWEFMFGEDATCRTTGDEVVLVTRSADAATLERSPGVVSLASEDGITVLGARISQGPLATLELGGVAAELYLRSGFSGPERDEVGSFRWNDGDESRLVLPASPGRSMQLSLLACPVVVSGEQQQLSVELNGAPVGTWTMRPQWDSYSIELPARLVREQNLLTFKYSLVIRPNDYGRSGDTRKLAVRFRSLTCKETGAT